jgi:hypothetical protein
MASIDNLEGSDLATIKSGAKRLLHAFREAASQSYNAVELELHRLTTRAGGEFSFVACISKITGNRNLPYDNEVLEGGLIQSVFNAIERLESRESKYQRGPIIVPVQQFGDLTGNLYCLEIKLQPAQQKPARTVPQPG